MGQRANLVIVEGGELTLYYDHWCANTLDVDLFWGPADARSFIEQRKPVAEWLDEVWCEGAAVLDCDRQVLVFFGGEDVEMEIDRRRKHLALMAGLWPGWEIRWAFEGLSSIAEYLELPMEPFRSGGRERGFSYYDEDADWNDVILSQPRGDGFEIYRISGDAEGLYPGPSAIGDVLETSPAFSKLDWTGDEPVGGIHFDPLHRRLFHWWAAPAFELTERVADAWPGWEIHGWLDRYEKHLDLLRGQLVYSPPSPESSEKAVLDALWRSLDRAEPRNPAREILGALVKDGRKVEINPSTDHTRGRLDVAKKRAMLRDRFGYWPQ